AGRHLELPHEENPFLGVRGARLLLRRPDLLEPRARYRWRQAGRHLELPHEENPFLGVRGARLLLRRPDLLEP
ncbi:hypothetical protein C7E25_24800, partial [Stenotrophomonas maltophilia]